MTGFNLELIRSANRIEDVVQEKFQLKKSGAHFTGVAHDSLVVNPRTGWYHWNSKDERGDVFDFAGRHLINGNWNSRDPVAFMEAVRYLAKRAGIALPENGDFKESPAWNERQLSGRLQEALYKEESALQYLTEIRGWSLDTIRTEQIGYMPQHKNLLLDGLTLEDKWLKVINRFPTEMIIYIHTENGQLVYLSGRAITEKRHYNPPRDLIGERRPYFNHEYHPDCDEVVIVEGQADAITLAEWEIPTVALAGMSISDDLLVQLKQHRRVYVMLDNTPDAQEKSREIAQALGPITCLPKLPEGVKDANEWLVKVRPGVEQVRETLNSAETLIDCGCSPSKCELTIGCASETME